MLPSWSWMMPWLSDSPNPVPWPGGLVVKKGSKIRPLISEGMPGPLSVTVSWTDRRFGMVRVVSVSVREDAVWRMA